MFWRDEGGTSKRANGDWFYWNRCNGKKYGKAFIKSRVSNFMCIREQRQKQKNYLAEGAKWAETPKEIAEHTNVIITMIGYPRDVEEVYLGRTRTYYEWKAGTYVIDMTTSKPSLAERIYR